MGDFFNGLTSVANWIETNIINGFMGGGFQAILKAILAFMSFKPIIDFFVALFSGAGMA